LENKNINTDINVESNMNNKEDITKECSSKEVIIAVTDAVKAVTVGARKIQKDAEGIEKSCYIHGTKGAAHRGELLAKVDNLRKLAVLYNSAAKRLMDLVMKLTTGVSEDAVLRELFSYGQFLADQLKSEENEAKRILDMLQKEAKTKIKEAEKENNHK
jgi:hypothetical protein